MGQGSEGQMGGGFRVQSSWGQRGRERGERVELPDILVRRAGYQSGGAGPEAAVPSPRWQEAEEAV